MNENGLNYIDLFAGAGGLSEGFIQSGYRPVAHVEMNEHAAKTIETRIAYYYLKDNLYKYTPMYSDGGKPELIEDDVFRINIPLARIAADEATEQKTLSEREQKIYNMICENLHLSVEQVMAELDISRSTVFRDYAKIKKVTGAVYDKKTSTWTL